MNCEMAKRTALCLVAPVSAVVDTITNPEFRFAQAILTGILVCITLCGEINNMN